MLGFSTKRFKGALALVDLGPSSCCDIDERATGAGRTAPQVAGARRAPAPSLGPFCSVIVQRLRALSSLDQSGSPVKSRHSVSRLNRFETWGSMHEPAIKAMVAVGATATSSELRGTRPRRAGELQPVIGYEPHASNCSSPARPAFLRTPGDAPSPRPGPTEADSARGSTRAEALRAVRAPGASKGRRSCAPPGGRAPPDASAGWRRGRRGSGRR